MLFQASILVTGLMVHGIFALPTWAGALSARQVSVPTCGSQQYSINGFTTFQAPSSGNSTIYFKLTNPNYPEPTSVDCSHLFLPGTGGPTSDAWQPCADNNSTFRYASAGNLEVNAEYWCEDSLVIGYAKGSLSIFSYMINGGTYSETPTSWEGIPVQSVEEVSGEGAE